MSASTVTIHASGSHTIKRTPELVDLNLRIHDEGPDPASALNAVRQASADISAHIRELAPPKGEVKSVAIDSEELDVDDEKLDPQFPVTSWSMQQLRTWSVVPRDDDNRPRGGQRTMMAMAAQTEEKAKPEKIYHAETYVRATFHDFAALGATIDKLTANEIVSVNSLNWEVTAATRTALQTRVRQGAYAGALAKAKDYARPIAPNAVPRPVEVHDDSMSHAPMRYRAAAPMRMMMVAETGGGGQETMSFEPEPIEISAQVRVQFALDL